MWKDVDQDSLLSWGLQERERRRGLVRSDAITISTGTSPSSTPRKRQNMRSSMMSRLSELSTQKDGLEDSLNLPSPTNTNQKPLCTGGDRPSSSSIPTWTTNTRRKMDSGNTSKPTHSSTKWDPWSHLSEMLD